MKQFCHSLIAWCGALLILGALFWGGAVHAAAPTWDSDAVSGRETGLGMPFCPAAGAASLQNPPDFTWPYVEGALDYSLCICRDSALQEPVLRLDGLSRNYLNLSEPLTAGESYYWAVRYRTAQGEESLWSEPRRFRIDPDAWVFTLPPAETLLERVPAGHPRVLTTQASLGDFRALRHTSETAQAVARRYEAKTAWYRIRNWLPEEPAWDPEIYQNRNQGTADYEAYLAYQALCKNTAGDLLAQVTDSAFTYLITGDQAVGSYAKKALLALASWKVARTEAATSYSFDDQIFREILYRSAMAYDWIYPLLTPEEGQTVRKMILERAKILDGLYTSIEKSPYNSHGWTTLGYLGIAAYALKDDLPEASDWLARILPLYSAVMPPWSGQDGGWAQGTDYWQYSTVSGKELTTVLKLGGVVDLYAKAWQRNEPLWALYAYPPGSYGSFGDQSNRGVADNSILWEDSLWQIAAYTQSPLAAWLAGQNQNLSLDYSAYAAAAEAEAVEPESPEGLPLGHVFPDIGWAVMSSSLTDRDRVQLTFKSSPYGSFNHSHADQNSFIIQAYGENLAIKSGYYDYYRSPHDSNFTRRSFAHNTVTLADAVGQVDDDIRAKGALELFTNHLCLDSVTGRAASAYGGTLNRFDRSILYLRPDLFVVIDDLEARAGETARFSWWLNGEQPMSYDDHSARIASGQAWLQARVAYPQDTTAAYYDGFLNPADGKTYLPTGSYTGANQQKRVAFTTGPAARTKMVVTLQAGRADQPAQEPQVTYGPAGDWLRLDYGPDVAVWVNTGDPGHTVDADGIRFRGAAAAVVKGAVQLVDGTYLEQAGRPLVQADQPVSAALGLGEVCLSAGTDQTQVILDCDNASLRLTDPAQLTDEKGRALSPALGIQTGWEPGRLTLTLERGSWRLLKQGVGAVSPEGLTVQAHVQRGQDGSAFLYWDEKEELTYDLRWRGQTVEGVHSPYSLGQVEGDAESVCLRARPGDWVEAAYVSGTAVQYPQVTYTTLFRDGNGYLEVRMEASQPARGDAALILAGYRNGVLTGLAADRDENGDGVLTAALKTGTGETYRAFLLGQAIEPLTSPGAYGADSLELAQICLDGVPLPDFDPARDDYTVACSGTQTVFPFVSAQPADQTTQVKILYDYGADTARICLTAPSGRSRTIRLTFRYEAGPVHQVQGATRADQFRADSGVSPDGAGNPAQVSRQPVGTLRFRQAGAEEELPLFLYTNLHGHVGPGRFGSRLFSDRQPASAGGNHLEVDFLPEAYAGADYFVLPNNTFTSQLQGDSPITEGRLSFTLEYPATVTVFSVKRLNRLREAGYRETMPSRQVTGRYLNTLGAEDVYYNTAFCGRSMEEIESDGSNYRFANYETADSWMDVSRLSGLEGYTLERFRAESVPIQRFQLIGPGSRTMARWKYIYQYAKALPPGEVTLDLGELCKSHERILVTLQPGKPLWFGDDIEGNA